MRASLLQKFDQQIQDFRSKSMPKGSQIQLSVNEEQNHKKNFDNKNVLITIKTYETYLLKDNLTPKFKQLNNKQFTIETDSKNINNSRPFLTPKFKKLNNKQSTIETDKENMNINRPPKFKKLSNKKSTILIDTDQDNLNISRIFDQKIFSKPLNVSSDQTSDIKQLKKQQQQNSFNDLQNNQKNFRPFCGNLIKQKKLYPHKENLNYKQKLSPFNNIYQNQTQSLEDNSDKIDNQFVSKLTLNLLNNRFLDDFKGFQQFQQDSFDDFDVQAYLMKEIKICENISIKTYRHID